MREELYRPLKTPKTAEVAAASLPGMIFVSRAMTTLAHSVERIKDSDSTVLITGESGTGKELVARGSPREPALAGPFHSFQLYGRARRLNRESSVRPPQGLVHGRARRPRRSNTRGRKRHALTRRDRRPAARPTAESPALPARGRSPHARRARAAARQRARAGGDAQRPSERCARRRVPRRLVLPRRGARRLRAAAARAARRYRGAHLTLHLALRAAQRARGGGDNGGGHRRLSDLPLAAERARACGREAAAGALRGRGLLHQRGGDKRAHAPGGYSRALGGGVRAGACALGEHARRLRAS